MRVNDIVGKPSPTLQDVARHHDVDMRTLITQLELGTKVEMEHTDDPREAVEIALDHLMELPDYYSRLKHMEKEKGA
jgi:hypothetical protein